MATAKKDYSQMYLVDKRLYSELLNTAATAAIKNTNDSREAFPHQSKNSGSSTGGSASLTSSSDSSSNNSKCNQTTHVQNLVHNDVYKGGRVLIRSAAAAAAAQQQKDKEGEERGISGSDNKDVSSTAESLGYAHRTAESLVPALRGSHSLPPLTPPSPSRGGAATLTGETDDDGQQQQLGGEEGEGEGEATAVHISHLPPLLGEMSTMTTMVMVVMNYCQFKQ